MKGATKTAKGAQARGRRSTQTARARGAGLQQPVEPDEQLGKIVGQQAQPRTQMIKRIWEYIRSHELQDAKDKRMIVPDQQLAGLFGGKKKVSMFEISGMLNQHVHVPAGAR